MLCQDSLLTTDRLPVTADQLPEGLLTRSLLVSDINHVQHLLWDVSTVIHFSFTFYFLGRLLTGAMLFFSLVLCLGSLVGEMRLQLKWPSRHAEG